MHHDRQESDRLPLAAEPLRPSRRSRRTLRRRVLVPLGLAALTAGLAATSVAAQPMTPGRAAPRARATAPLAVRTAMVTVHGHLELVLTNAAGRTLYYLTSDTATHYACSGACLKFWPPLRGAATSVSHPATVHGRFTFHQGPNGHQVEYNGHPLYTFSGDKGPRQDHGEGIHAFGGTWWVATPGLRPAAPTTGKPTPTPTKSGGYGY